MRVLRVLAGGNGAMRLREIAERTGLSTTTTHRILGSLVENKLCERDRDGRYQLGLTLFELGMRVQSGLDLRERSRPLLERLSDDTHLTSFLCVRREERAVCLERISGRDAFTLALEAGGSLPLHVGAAPRVLLAYEPTEEVARYLAEHAPLQRFTASTVTKPAAIIADLAVSRERGWVVSDEDVTVAVAALAAPVFGFHDALRPVGAISVAGLRVHVLGKERDAILTALLRTAQEISTAMGAFGEVVAA